MTWWQSLILGLVEGVTEFLPVSSTGHLILMGHALGLPKSDALESFDIAVQGGAILAVFGLYAKRVRQILAGLAGRDAEGLRLLTLLAAAFVPTGAIAFLCRKTIKAYLLGLWPTVAAWFVGGLVILALAGWLRRKHAAGGKRLHELSIPAAALIGVVQCLALWPGTSRSLVTILAGLVVGLSLEAALEFSFLLGAVTLLAATGYEATKNGKLMVETFSAPVLAVGAVAAFVSAWAAVRWMVAFLQRRGWAVFGVYRVLLAVGVAALILGGYLSAK